MKQEIILPITEPLLKVHSYHAFAFSVMLTSKISLPWIFSNYISLYGVLDKKDGDFIYFENWSRFNTLPYTFVMQLHKLYLDKKFPDIINFVLDCLCDKLYINLLVDEYFIPNTIYFQKKHFTHCLFIYGYNLKKKVFYVAGYFNSPRQYKNNVTITFSEFENSYRNSSKTKILMNQSIELIKFPYFEPPYGEKYKLDLKLIKKSILDYIESTELFLNFRPIPNENIDYSNVYGLEVFNLLKSKLLKNQNISMKALQTLVEHKTIMLKRIEYLLAKKVLGYNSLLEEYQSVVQTVFMIHQLCIKYFITKKNTLLDNIIENINKVMENEKNVLRKLAESIILS